MRLAGGPRSGGEPLGIGARLAPVAGEDDPEAFVGLEETAPKAAITLPAPRSFPMYAPKAGYRPGRRMSAA